MSHLVIVTMYLISLVGFGARVVTDGTQAMPFFIASFFLLCNALEDAGDSDKDDYEA